MSHKSVRVVVLAVSPALWLGGCNLVADLSQFDRARDAGADAADTSAIVADARPAETAVVDDGGEGLEAAGDDADGGDGSSAGDASDSASDASDAADASDSAADVALGPANLIVNGGFEQGTSPWGPFGTVSLDESSTAHTGQFSGWVHNRLMGDYEGVVQDITANIVQGHTYNVSAWALCGVPAGADAGDASTSLQQLYMTVAVTCQTAGGTDTGYTPLQVVHTGNSSTWTELTGYFQMSTVPFTFSDANNVSATCTSVTQIRFYVAGPSAGVDLFVDDVSFLR